MMSLQRIRSIVPFLARSAAQQQRFLELAREPNHPLHWPDRRLGLIWSAKGGCTVAVKWFFFQIGLLEEALAYSSWIHHYRVRVFCHSESFRQSMQRAARYRYSYIKVVRNPYQRAVGSFLHLVKTRGAMDFHRPVNEYLGRDLDDGISFSEFVAFLESTNLHECDIHYRVQQHSLEREGLLKIRHLLRLDNLGESLPALEQDLGLARSPLDELFQSHHHTLSNRSQDFCGDRPTLFSDDGEYPPFQCFYDDEIRRRVYNLYRCDFDSYGFGPELPAVGE